MSKDELFRVVDRRAPREGDSAPRPANLNPKQVEFERTFNMYEREGLNPKVEVSEKGIPEIVVDPVLPVQEVVRVQALTPNPVRTRDGIPVYPSDRRLALGEKIVKSRKERLMSLDADDLKGWGD